MSYTEFLKHDILSLLHDYGEMTPEGVNSILGANLKNVRIALNALVEEGKAKKTDKSKYDAVDELTVKRLKKDNPTIF